MLPVVTVVRETYTHTITHAGPLALLVGVILAVVVPAFTVWPYLFVAAASHGPVLAAPVLIWLSALSPIVLTLGAWIVGAVRWHRVILVDERATAPLKSLWRPARTYLLRTLAVYVPVGLLMWCTVQLVVATQLPYAHWMIVLLLAVALGRVAIAFPAAAVNDRRVDLRSAIQLTRGNTSRLFLAWLMIAVPIEVSRYLIGTTLVLIPFSTWLNQPINLALSSATVLLTVTLVSMCYRYFATPVDRRPATRPV